MNHELDNNEKKLWRFETEDEPPKVIKTEICAEEEAEYTRMRLCCIRKRFIAKKIVEANQ